MIYIYKDRIIRLEWTILKGTSNVNEDFSRALVKLFLIGPADKYLLDATAENGVITAMVPEGLPEGNYSVEVIYAKNWGNLRRGDAPCVPPTAIDPKREPKPVDERFNDRCLMRSRKDDLFGITNYESEADNVGEGEVVVTLKTSVATYGYDGLSSYELSVMRGSFIGSESAFIALINKHVTEHFAKYVNSIHLEWNGNAYLTRIQVIPEMRRKGLMISYVNGEGKSITEKCVFDADTIDAVWGVDSSWQSVRDLVLGGELFVSPNGTWVIDGVDSGINAVGMKGDNGISPLLKTIDNKLYYSYDGVNWEVTSEDIAAWFRWSGNKIQISRDNKTWEDFSGEFADNLFIKGYVATFDELPADAVQGDIWGVGPRYAAEDTENTNPIYRYWVRNAGDWVDNGEFTSIAAGIVQETGDGDNVVMSQKAVSGKLAELESGVSILLGNVGNTILDYTIRGGEYISSTGIKKENDNYSRTSDIIVKAHNTLTVYAAGYGSNISIISKVEDSIYTPLLIDNGSTDGVLTAYTYRNENDADIIVTCSFSNPQGISIFISDNASVEYANEINKRSINNTQCISSIYDGNRSIYTINPSTEIGYYINDTGLIKSNAAFIISEPISVKEGDVISVMAKGYLSNVSIISKYTNGYYEPLVISDNSEYKEYNYTVDSNCQIVICTNVAYKIEVNIETKSITSTLEDVRYINKEIRENGSIKGLHIPTDGVLVSASVSYIIYFYIAENDGVYSFSYQLDNVPGAAVGGLGKVNSIGDIVEGGVLSDFLVKPSTALSYDVSVSVKKGDILILSTNTAIRNALKVVAKTQVTDIVGQTKVPLTDFSMFEKFAVIGDSYASGQIYNADNTSLGTFYNLSWGQVLARKHGNVCINMSKGGMTTVSWLADNSKGLGLLQNSEVQQLYICALGINDSSYVELGSASDIGTSAETFYGAYSRIIDAIISKAPNAKIIIATLANASKYDYNNAIIDIANHYGIPCIREDEDEFFLSSFYKDNMVGGHPTAPVYAGMATAFDRMIQQCIVDNVDYFKVI